MQTTISKLSWAALAALALSAVAVPAEARKVKKFTKPNVAALQKACDKGTLKDCVRLGYYTLDGYYGATQDNAKAGAMFKKACDGGDPAGCSGLARQMSYTADALKPDVAALFTKGCDKGDAPGCYWLGRFEKDITKRSEWMKKAYKAYIAACDAGDAPSCEEAAQMNRNSHQDFYDSTVAWDEEAATKLFADACAADYGSSCAYLGGQYEGGRGAVQDFKKAKLYYQKGCTLGDSQACEWLADLKARGF